MQTDENGCHTAPNGDCISKGPCIHTPADAAEHITVYDGKYTLIMEPTAMRALRYGEPWRDLVGDGFVMALGQEILDLKEKLEKAEIEASRWRALLAACPRLQGSAGLEYGGDRNPETGGIVPDGTVTPKPEDKGYMHAGIEFWTQASPPYFEAARTSPARAVLTAIADQIIAQGGEGWAMENGQRVSA